MSLSFTPTQVFAIVNASALVEFYSNVDPGHPDAENAYDRPEFLSATCVIRAKYRFEREFKYYMAWKHAAQTGSRSNLSAVRQYHRLLVGAIRVFQQDYEAALSNQNSVVVKWEDVRRSDSELVGENIPSGYAIDLMDGENQTSETLMTLSEIFNVDFLRFPE